MFESLELLISAILQNIRQANCTVLLQLYPSPASACRLRLDWKRSNPIQQMHCDSKKILDVQRCKQECLVNPALHALQHVCSMASEPCHLWSAQQSTAAEAYWHRAEISVYLRGADQDKTRPKICNVLNCLVHLKIEPPLSEVHTEKFTHIMQNCGLSAILHTWNITPYWHSWYTLDVDHW